jgi:hypothetical protein
MRDCMNKPPAKSGIDFNEALRRIAHTPKDAVIEQKNPLVNKDLKDYNAKKAAKKPPSPAKRRP